MTRPAILAILALLSLAACGAAGAPEAPASGVAMSGSAEMGMARDGG